MKKNIFGRKLKRDVNERRALFKGLISSLILKERIKTTEAKAKAIKGDIDKIITKVKKNGELSRRLISDKVLPHAFDKLLNDITPRFANRSGGYTRILRIGKRFGDDASMVLMEWTEGKSAASSPTPAPAAHKAGTKSKRVSRSLSEGRQLSSTRKLRRTSRPSVASRSGKGTSQK